MIVIIDNYDSFTYNLVQYVGVIDTNLEVFRNDEITIESLASKQISHIIISPGPGWPDDAGKTMDIIKCFNNSTPILGICLGHQAIVRAFNGDIVKCNEIIHGKTSAITFKPSKLFKKLTVSVPISSRNALLAIGANLVSVYLIAAGGSLSTDPKFPCPSRAGYLVEKFCTSLTSASYTA